MAILRDIGVVADDEPAKESDARAAKAKTVRWIAPTRLAFGGSWRRQPVPKVRVREPEVAHQRRLEHAGKPHGSLVRVIVGGDPGGFDTAARKTSVGVDGPAHEQRMAVVNAVIQTQAGKMALQRLLGDMVQAG